MRRVLDCLMISSRRFLIIDLLRNKQDGQEGLAYVYKTLMNSLIGSYRQGASSVTEICDRDRYRFAMMGLFKQIC
uniref:Uncharacterized protein n=1 Tax=Utricularia reniformis TaxID=192314 RepID=A0A1Y0B1I9_9LAMI|nr:hypothetical protein AEK19_MT0995 [Utricularia reniformis]ART31219.1 hypothetical protein AEK19_MT0995 [Utricularia reniformis]